MKIHMEGFLEETSKSKEYISKKKKKKDCTSYLKIPSFSGKEENTRWIIHPFKILQTSMA